MHDVRCLSEGPRTLHPRTRRPGLGSRASSMGMASSQLRGRPSRVRVVVRLESTTSPRKSELGPGLVKGRRERQ